MQEHDVCVRYSGSCNTGATVIVEQKKYKFHHIPVSVIYNKPAYIASQCLLNPQRLMEEINIFKKLGFNIDANLFISPDCNIITAEHIQRDAAKEISHAAVGSTKSGVSPCASDKYGREGIKIGLLPEFKQYFVDVSRDINSRMANGQNILFEGSQGTLLDVDHGFVYPCISTTSNIAAAACVSTGIGPTKINRVVGIFKAYMTKVGKGPFPTKIRDEEIANKIIEKGFEYGTTTGRKRDVGWLDIPLLKYACSINGVTELAMTKFDVLEGIKKFIAWNYDKEFPIWKDDIYECNPILSEIATDIATDYAAIIESEIGIPITIIGNGPERHQIIPNY
jgi:adenylosuccinate synthase